MIEMTKRFVPDGCVFESASYRHGALHLGVMRLEDGHYFCCAIVDDATEEQIDQECTAFRDYIADMPLGGPRFDTCEGVSLGTRAKLKFGEEITIVAIDEERRAYGFESHDKLKWVPWSLVEAPTGKPFVRTPESVAALFDAYQELGKAESAA